MTSLQEREAYIELMQAYKEAQCLWNVTHVNYANKEIRKSKFEELLVIYQKWYPPATIICLRKKLDGFRCGYLKARKKVVNKVLNGDKPRGYQPSLWYYSHMSFLSRRNGESRENKKKKVKKMQRPSTIEIRDTKQMVININSESGETLDRAIETKPDSPDCISTYAESIAIQLRELDDSVRQDAERIIADVISRARNGTLPKYTPQAVDTMIPHLGPSWYELSVQDETQQATQYLANIMDDVKSN